MERKRKYGWTAMGIVGMVFAPIGGIFLAIGIALRFSRSVRRTGNPELFLYTFGGIGLLFLLLGLAFLYSDLRRRALMRRAFEGGYYVMAKVAGIAAQRNVNMNGRNPYQVEAHWTDPNTGIVHVYYSRYFYTNVADMLTSDEVPVYLDRMDNSVGFVDVDAILPEIRVHH